MTIRSEPRGHRPRIAGRLALGLTIALAWTGRAPLAHAGPTEVNASREERDASRAAFRRGVAEARASNWPAARVAFEEAYRAFPHPSILLNLGLARLRTGDPAQAEEDLVRFLSEDSGASMAESSSAREALAEARRKLGTVRLSVDPSSARVSVDGRSVPIATSTGAAELVLRLPAGSHRVSADEEGFTAADEVVVVVAQSESRIALHLDASSSRARGPQADARSSSPVRAVVGYSLLGLAGTSLLVSGGAALRALSLSRSYRDASSERFGDPGTRSEGIAWRTTADVALGVALVSGVVGVVLLVTGAASPSRPAAAALAW